MPGPRKVAIFVAPVVASLLLAAAAAAAASSSVQDPSIPTVREALAQDDAVVDCRIGNWGPWSACDAYTLTRERSRPVVTAPTLGGRACPVTKQTAPCAPIDCLVGDWGPWGPCEPASGQRRRERAILREPAWGGRACPFTEQFRPCRVADGADAVCVVGRWSPWSPCDETTGLKQRARMVIHEGRACPALVEHAPCDPIDCVLAEVGSGDDDDDGDDAWDEWGPCDPESGQRMRVRAIRVLPRYNGTACPPPWARSENATCSPVDCQLGPWFPWGDCDVTIGLRRRTRDIEIHPRDGGAACGALSETQSCAPVDCVLEEEREDEQGQEDDRDWGACDASSGQRHRIRAIRTPARFGGRACPPPEARIVSAPCPPVDWPALPLSARACPQHGGAGCGPVTEVGTCEPVDCVLGAWGNWGECDPVTLEKSRTRPVLVAPQHSGRACRSTEDRAPCTAVHCILGEWSPWGACRRGRQTRTREIVTPRRFGGRPCGAMEEARRCRASDCIVGDWCEWSACDAQGQRHRSREVVHPRGKGGRACPALEEIASCRQDCVLSEWGPWDDCSDDTGLRTRTRGIKIPAAFGGRPCPPENELAESEACPTIDCVYGDWGAWSSCHEATSERSRSRSVLLHARWGGRPCVTRTETEPCRRVDCVVDTWGPWSSCDGSDDAREQNRTRSILLEPRHGGRPCPGPVSLTQHRTCRPVDCEVSSWGPWSDCQDGERLRHREVLVPARHGGDDCPVLMESTVCDREYALSVV